jgi:hypothetical protein
MCIYTHNTIHTYAHTHTYRSKKMRLGELLKRSTDALTVTDVNGVETVAHRPDYKPPPGLLPTNEATWRGRNIPVYVRVCMCMHASLYYKPPPGLLPTNEATWRGWNIPVYVRVHE